MFHQLSSANKVKGLHICKSKLDPLEEEGALQNLNSFSLQYPILHLGSILIVTSSLLVSLSHFLCLFPVVWAEIY